MLEKFKGMIVAESLENTQVLDGIEVIQEEFAIEENWYIKIVEITRTQIEGLSKQIKEGWYMHFWQNDDVIVVFRNKIFEFRHSDKDSWQPAIDYGINIGIPSEQLDFPIK